MSEKKGLGLKDWLTGPRQKETMVGARPESPVKLDRHRIAVLPFTNMSPNRDDEYFADGTTEELISTLSNISNLTVISRTSIMQYKRAKKNLSDIGKELRAGTLLEGSVRKAGNRVRITVQLLDAIEDKHLWSQSYDRELHDVFAVQSDIATSVADALKVKLLSEDTSQIQKKPTENTEAYLLYLKGRQYWNRRSEDNLKKAIDCFTNAISLDSNFALAYVGLADCYRVMSVEIIPFAEAAQKTKALALNALRLDKTLAEAHTSYASVLENEWNWDAAEAEYKKAIELNPNYATAHHWYSLLLRTEGRLEEALAEAKKSLELDPLASVTSVAVGIAYLVLERYDEAIESYIRALAIEPNNHVALLGLTSSYSAKRELNRAMDYWQKFAQLVPRARALVELARIQARAERRDEALASLDSALKLPDAGKLRPTWIAWVYAALHDEDETFEWLEKALKENSWVEFKAYPDLKAMRSNPRFLKILKEMGLDKY